MNIHNRSTMHDMLPRIEPKYETKNFFVGPFSQKDASDLALVETALTAFWSAVNLDARRGTTRQHPIKCCVQSALTVRDIMHKMGRRDATVMRSGLDIRMLGGTGNILSIGSMDAQRTPGLWNAHMIVRLGRVLIDPTIGQAKRPWNVLPHSAIYEGGANSGDDLKIVCGTNVKVTTSQRFSSHGHNYQISYYKLPLRCDLMTKSWRSDRNSCPERRQQLVHDAMDTLQNAPSAMAA